MPPVMVDPAAVGRVWRPPSAGSVTSVVVNELYSETTFCWNCGLKAPTPM